MHGEMISSPNNSVREEIQMSEMIERVMAAIGSKVMGEQSINLKEAAKAAIAAMREPTKKMEDAAYNSDAMEEGSSPYGCWKSMIDAALEE